MGGEKVSVCRQLLNFSSRPRRVGRRCPQRAGMRRETVPCAAPIPARRGEDTAPYHFAFSRKLIRVLSLAFSFVCLVLSIHAAEPSSAFDQANKLYEQGKFAEAVTAYEAFAFTNPPTASVWFNLGNAAYKSGQSGRAIAAYRLAERLTPRDAALRANLQFVRGKVYSDERTRLSLAKSLVRLATLNEWTTLTVI